MKIGNIKPVNNIFLAPMAGVCDSTFRRICRSWGAGLTYTEMISAKGLYYNDKKTAELMKITPEEQPCAVQLFGSEPEIMASVVDDALSTGAKFLDINMGCPAPKIVSNGDGSALMKNPNLIGDIVSAVVRESGVPVTVKIRAGYTEINALEVAKIIEASGASAICVHPRTREMFYSGKADRSIIKEIKEKLSIPVIASGDLFTAEDVASMLEETACDAVMIARGAEGNPFIFRQVQELLTNGRVDFYPTHADKLTQAISHTEQLCTAIGDDRGIKEARKHIAWYLKGLPGASAVKCKIFTMSDKSAVIDTLSTLRYELSKGT